MARLIALYTGGKDSTLAVQKALEAGHEIAILLTTQPSSEDSWMFHTACLGVQHILAKSMGLEHAYVQVSGEREREVKELADHVARIAKEYGADGILSGSIASLYQKSRIDSMAAKLGLLHLAPNWGAEPRGILEELLARRYRVMIVAVSTAGLGREWVGRSLDRESVDELFRLSEQWRFNPAGEGGEYETLVLDAPIYRLPLGVEYTRVWLGDRGHIKISRAMLVERTA
jgi:Predicted ATPases of PP-loop superfamily